VILGRGVKPGQMVIAIDSDHLQKTLKDRFHGPVKTQFGYHLVQVFFRDWNSHPQFSFRDHTASHTFAPPPPSGSGLAAV